MDGNPRNDLGELARLFLKLGIIGFGGPAAHIAMMEDEVVERRAWMSRQRFLDMVGATNLIPGPNSTEMAIHIGHARGGLPGLVIAGACFILPAVGITSILAWLYVQYGTLPQADPILYGIRPVVVAIIFSALWKLSGKALKTKALILIGVAVATAALLGSDEILALLAGGLLGIVLVPPRGRARAADTSAGEPRTGATEDAVHGADGSPGSSGDTAGAAGSTSGGTTAGLMALGATRIHELAAPVAATLQPGGASLLQLFLYFLTIGSVLYGSGYVLFAFLEGGLVGDLGWLTQEQLIDAVAIGQFTPGPVLSTATFVGYLVAGPAGAAVATSGIFLPSFLFVWLLTRILPWMRASAWLRAFLDGVNASAVALMTVVTLRLAMEAFTGWETALLGIVAAVAAVRFRVNAAFLVLVGGIAGWILA